MSDAAPLATLPATGSPEPEVPSDAAAIEALVLAAFGPGRYAKTAERLREGSRPLAGFVLREGGRLIGSVRLWPVTVEGRRAAFLGPIAVEASRREGGLGAALVEAAVAAARAAGHDGVLLVGTPWFARFGFAPAPQVRLPGPVARARIWWLPLDGREPPAGDCVRG